MRYTMECGGEACTWANKASFSTTESQPKAPPNLSRCTSQEADINVLALGLILGSVLRMNQKAFQIRPAPEAVTSCDYVLGVGKSRM